MKRTALAYGLALAAVLSACSSMNPFASKPDPKTLPAELAPIQQTKNLLASWQVNVGTAGEYLFTPAVVNDTVYAAAEDGSIARFDGGKQVWRVSAGQSLSGGVGSDGHLVVVGTSKGDVLTFSADNGKLLWKTHVSSEVLAAPAVGENLVVVRSGDSRVFAFEAADGKRRWVYQRSTPPLSLRSSVGVSLAPGGVLAGFPGGKLVAIAAANGATYWEANVALPRGSTELERVADVTSAPVVSEREVCAVAFQGRVACFDAASGNMLWSRDVSSISGLDVDSHGVYVSDDAGMVLAFDRASGASLWKQDKLRNRGLARPIALDGVLAVGDFQGYVHLLRSEDGAFVGRAQTDGSAIAAEPKRSGSGIVVQTRKGGVYTFAVE